MSKVTEAVVQEVTRLIHCVHGFNANGALQVGLYLVYRKITLLMLCSPQTGNIYIYITKYMYTFSGENPTHYYR